jgi:ribonuclease HI
MRITKNLLTEARLVDGRLAGGLNRNQMIILGEAWPPKQGWMNRLLCLNITDEKWQEVLDARKSVGRFLPKKERRAIGTMEMFASKETKASGKIVIRFDGGCRPTNPGNKYGSYSVEMGGQQIALVSRVEFGFGTNNEAEFDALESALKWTVSQLETAGNIPAFFDLEMWSDSTIVANRIAGHNRSVKTEPQQRMNDRAIKCLCVIMLFHSFRIFWNERDNNVSRFGH